MCQSEKQKTLVFFLFVILFYYKLTIVRINSLKLYNFSDISRSKPFVVICRKILLILQYNTLDCIILHFPDIRKSKPLVINVSKDICIRNLQYNTLYCITLHVFQAYANLKQLRQYIERYYLYYNTLYYITLHFFFPDIRKFKYRKTLLIFEWEGAFLPFPQRFRIPSS